MRNTIYYKWFTERMSESDKKQYRQMSINQQKDWYIMYLEDHYQSHITICPHCSEIECECEILKTRNHE